MPFPLGYIEQRDAQWGVKGTGAEARIASAVTTALIIKATRRDRIASLSRVGPVGIFHTAIGFRA